MSAGDVHAAIAYLPDGRTPRFSEVITSESLNVADEFGTHGWRIETFVADELLRCRQGRLFENAQDTVLSRLLYGRTAPIAAAILVTIDLPSDG